jgi:crotonobetainyl-CoA:carnitine CoA-transferase CaiB-like acyl-CoA transferase
VTAGIGGDAPLEGVRVVDLTRLLPGAYCTLVLADLGAQVVKVEDPDSGDMVRTVPPYVGGLSVYHHALNRNKRSVTLDLRAADAFPVLDRLVAAADVLIESFRPGTARRLKVSAGDVRARHPRVVHCSLTGFGQSGPYAERAAHDLDFVALAGLFEIDRPDPVPRLLVADVGSAWAATAGILAALFQRERTGHGSAVDIAIHDVAASWLTFPAAAATMGRPTAPGSPLPIGGDAACYNVYQTADGRHVALAAIEQKFWQTFCQRIGRPEFIPLQLVPGEQDALREAVAATFRERGLADWLAMFADVDVCLAPVKTIAEALADPQLVERGAVAAHGDSRFIRAPIVFNAASAGDKRPDRLPIVPARPLGADTDEVLRALGFGDAELAKLHARRVV